MGAGTPELPPRPSSAQGSLGLGAWLAPARWLRGRGAAPTRAGACAAIRSFPDLQGSSCAALGSPEERASSRDEARVAPPQLSSSASADASSRHGTPTLGDSLPYPDSYPSTAGHGGDGARGLPRYKRRGGWAAGAGLGSGPLCPASSALAAAGRGCAGGVSGGQAWGGESSTDTGAPLSWIASCLPARFDCCLHRLVRV